MISSVPCKKVRPPRFDDVVILNEPSFGFGYAWQYEGKLCAIVCIKNLQQH